jgi:hypothetical protein
MYAFSNHQTVRHEISNASQCPCRFADRCPLTLRIDVCCTTLHTLSRPVLRCFHTAERSRKQRLTPRAASITRIPIKDVPCHGPKPRFMYGLGRLYRGCGPNARFCPHACIHRIVCNRQTTEQAMFAEIIDAFTGGSRLKACSTGLPVLLETADSLPIGVFFAPKMIIPLLFLLSQGSLEGCRLSAVEVQGCTSEQRSILRDEDVLYSRSCTCQFLDAWASR